MKKTSFFVLALSSTLCALSASAETIGASPSVRIDGASAAKVLSAFADFQDARAPGVTYEGTSTQANRSVATGSYQGQVFIDCQDAVGKTPAHCEITLLQE